MRPKKMSLILCTLAIFSFMCLRGEASDARMQNVGQKTNLAVSDYLEAIASCNGALRKSAERQFRRLRDKADMVKNEAHRNYVSSAGLLNQTYQELGQYFDEPSTGKMLMDQVINAAGLVPGVGSFAAAYSAVNTLYSYADEHIRSRDGKTILARAKKIFDDMAKYNEEFKKWDDYEKNLSRREDELARQFDRSCAGRPTDEWRYTPGVADQSGAVDVDYSGHDRASGEVFEGTGRNNTGQPWTLEYGPGTMLFPLNHQDYQRIIIAERQPITIPPGQLVEFPLTGFCADPFAYPPPPESAEDGLSWFPGEIVQGPSVSLPYNPFNEDFLSVPRIPGTIEDLLENGDISPTGLPREMEKVTVSQWYIWNVFENFDEDDGRTKITEQVRESGGSQTPEQINELNENIWGGISLVKKKVREERTSTQGGDS